MKSLYKIILALTAIALIAVSCSDDDDKAVNVDSVKILQTDQDTIYLDKGDVYKVQIETSPPNQAVRYYTSDANVFTVSIDGTITALEGGSASLLIAAPNRGSWINTKCVINVTAYVESIEINAGKEVIILPEGQALNASTLFTAYPENASDRSMKYRSSDPSILTIDEDGVITTISKGKVQITAVPADGKHDVVSDPVTIYSQYANTLVSKSGWTATASSYYSSYRPSNIFDGSNSTGWSTSWSGGGTFPPYWLLIDMQSEREFDQVILYQMSWLEAKTVELQISSVITDGLEQDDPSFETIGTFDFSGGIRNKTLMYFPDVKHKTRYIKLYMPDNNNTNSNSLAEIYLYNVE